MPGESLGHAAGSGDDEDVDIAVVLAGEGDAGAVGREGGIGFGAGAAGEADGVAAFARDAPQVARVDEDDVSFAEGWLLQQQRFVRGGGDGGNGAEGEYQTHKSP